jgi:hypothetical protein
MRRDDLARGLPGAVSPQPRRRLGGHRLRGPQPLSTTRDDPPIIGGAERPARRTAALDGGAIAEA